MALSLSTNRAAILLSISCLLITTSLTTAAAAAAAKSQRKDWQTLDYRVFPRRFPEESAVIEWGNSAIINAIDGSVALFGPQTSEAALFEVEAAPVMAQPVSGVNHDDAQAYLASWNDYIENNLNETLLNIPDLENADAVFGNLVIMTDVVGLSGVQMARIAQKAGAAALLVVHIVEGRPDEIYRLPADKGSETIEIPVVVISVHSANLMVSAVGNELPDRVRLYAGGDRPFFEDITAPNPALYMIHNLLTKQECEDLIERAKNLVEPVTGDDPLQYTVETDKMIKTKRVHLWQGMWQTPSVKTIEERIEQVTGFPQTHFTDFIIDRLDEGSYWTPRYDAVEPHAAMATLHIFLTDETIGGSKVYPAVGKGRDPVKIDPRQGTAVVHHNLNEHNTLDFATLHAIMPVQHGPVYVATKYILLNPQSIARRLVLPLIAIPTGGRLPHWVLSVYKFFVDKFGPDQGDAYFDKASVFLPVLLVLGLVQSVVEYMQRKKPATKSTTTTASKAAAKSTTKDTSAAKTKKEE
jgi:hypothetical protein